MELPELKFYFEYFGHCAWVDGCGMKYDTLPISESLMKELKDLCDEYDDQIDWSDPGSSEGWTLEHENDFRHRAAIVGKKLQEELSGIYTVINCFEEYINYRRFL